MAEVTPDSVSAQLAELHKELKALICALRGGSERLDPSPPVVRSIALPTRSLEQMSGASTESGAAADGCRHYKTAQELEAFLSTLDVPGEQSKAERS